MQMRMSLSTLREIAIGVIISAIGSYISYILNTRGVFDLVNIQFPLWIIIIAIVILLTFMIIYMRFKRKSSDIFVSVARKRPRNNVTTFDTDMFGVKWKVDYGSFTFSSEPYAWCKSKPYCPDCLYEMDTEKRGRLFKNHYWKCHKCGKYYKCTSKSPYNSHEIIEKMLEADIRSGRLKLS